MPQIKKIDYPRSLESMCESVSGAGTPLKHSRHFWGFFIFLCIIFSTLTTYAYTDNQIADAIYHAENSKSHPYGILQHYKHTSPRQACINTIRHAQRDWNGRGDFIDFLQKRYAPLNVSNDPTGLNRNWSRNVHYFLRRGV